MRSTKKGTDLPANSAASGLMANTGSAKRRFPRGSITTTSEGNPPAQEMRGNIGRARCTNSTRCSAPSRGSRTTRTSISTIAGKVSRLLTSPIKLARGVYVKPQGIENNSDVHGLSSWDRLSLLRQDRPQGIPGRQAGGLPGLPWRIRCGGQPRRLFHERAQISGTEGLQQLRGLPPAILLPRLPQGRGPRGRFPEEPLQERGVHAEDASVRFHLHPSHKGGG